MNGEPRGYPFEIKKLDPEEHAEVFKQFDGDTCVLEDFIRIGPKSYWYPSGFAEMAPKIYNMDVRPNDIWLITFPKSGTTFIQELMWLVLNDFDYHKAVAIPLMERFPFLELTMFFNTKKAQRVLQRDEVNNKVFLDWGCTRLSKWCRCSRRGTSSHTCHCRCCRPPCWTPAACCTSRATPGTSPFPTIITTTFSNTWVTRATSNNSGIYLLEIVDRCPYFENVKESWRMRNHPNMLFMFYEDALKDLPSTVKRVAAFLGKTVTEEQVSRLCEHLAFDNFKKNKSVNLEVLKNTTVVDKERSFVRNGKAGGWREYFDEEMMQQAQR